MTWDEIWSQHKHFSDYSITLYKYLDDIAEGLEDGSRVLEAGCGSGEGLKIFRERGHRGYGIDISKQSVYRIKGETRIHGALSSIFNLPFENASFDLTYNSGVVEHFPYPADVAALREMARVTKPGGKMVVIVPNKFCPFYIILKQGLNILNKWPYGYERSYTLNGLLRIVREEGSLELKRVFGLLPLPPMATHNFELLPFGIRKKIVMLGEHLPMRQWYSYAIGVECIKL